MVEVHQGYFGNVNRSHSVLAFTSPEKALQNEVLPKSDRPFVDELQGQWPAFISGRPLGRHYLIMRTFPDRSASRAGMVFSHALLIPMAQAILIDDLRIVFAHLVQDIPAAPHFLQPLNIEIRNIGQRPESPLLAAAITSYVQSQPRVTLDGEGFPDLVTAMWWGLPPALRQSFSFGMCMTADNLVDQGYHLALAPHELIRRWTSDLVLTSTVASPIPSAAEAMLLMCDKRIPNLINALEIKLESLEQLKHLDKASTYLENSNLTFDQLRALISWVSHLSPLTSKGSALKKQLATKLGEAIRLALASDLKKLRNLDLPGFAKFLPEIWATIEATMLRHLLHVNLSSQIEVLEGIKLAVETPDLKWSEAISSSIQSWLHQTNSLELVWEFCRAYPKYCSDFIALLPPTSAIEKQLINSLDQDLAKGTLQIWLSKCVQNNWYRLHATIAVHNMVPFDAITVQLAMDFDQNHLFGLAIIAEKTPKAEFFKIVQEIQDERLIALATKYCIASPQCRQWIDLSLKAGRQILLNWLEARPSDRDILDQSSVFELLRLLLDGQEIENGLLRHFLDQGLGDLLEFPDRVIVWNALPIWAKDRFLETTALSWLKQSQAQPHHIEVPEPELILSIISNGSIDQFLRTTPIQAAFVNGLFKSIAALTESMMIAALLNERLTGSEFDAPAIGLTIKNKNWNRAAKVLFEERFRKRWLHTALRSIEPLLSFFDKIVLSLEGSPPVPESEFWDQLGKIAIEIYPKGPDKLFESLKWDESDLSNNDSRKEQWEHVIRLTKRGKDGYTVRKLIIGMLQNHPHNEKLKLLKSYAETHHL
jgi:hypothetical protein